MAIFFQLIAISRVSLVPLLSYALTYVEKGLTFLSVKTMIMKTILFQVVISELAPLSLCCYTLFLIYKLFC